MNESLDKPIELERFYKPALDEIYIRQLGSIGLYDASQEVYATNTSEDDQWVIRSNN